MVQIILIIGYLLIALCLAGLIAPNILRKMVDFYYIENRLYRVGFMRLVLGVILLLAANQAKLWGYVVLFGLLAAASGLSIFFFPLRRTKQLLVRIKSQSDLKLRLLTAIAIALWALLIYALLP